MPEEIIKTVHTITVSTEIPFPEAFPGMSLKDAIKFQKHLDLESVVDCMVVGTTKLRTDVSVNKVDAVQPAPEEDETTRACVCDPGKCEADPFPDKDEDNV